MKTTTTTVRKIPMNTAYLSHKSNDWLIHTLLDIHELNQKQKETIEALETELARLKAEADNG